MPTTLSAITAALPTAEQRGEADVVDATHDSRQVEPGWLFCCVVGHNVDGHDFAPAAVAAGASALLVQRFLDLDVPQVRVPDVRASMGPAAAVVHGDPSDELRVVGITGTNGKTTTTYLLETAFGANAWGTGVIGTVETRINGEPITGVRTTPEGTDLQRLLRRMHDRGADAVAMEVSSHGLDLHRVAGVRFSVAAFTNLTQDHLDWHGSMEAYFDSKAQLFASPYADRGVVCVDDEWGRRLAAEAPIAITTYGAHPSAEHRITGIDADLTGTTARLAGPDGEAVVRTRLLGEHNGKNAVAAYLCARAIGIDAEVALAGIAACGGVPGRFEPVQVGQPFAVVVDYAHTPDALQHVVSAARDLLGAAGRLHVVIGCGGDRDRGKRPLMGAVAAQADVAHLTSDNPRSEDPAAILAEVEAGAIRAVEGGAPAELVVEVDRRRAIEAAVGAAREGDVVVVAGKGHETGQYFADHTIDFDDRLVAREALLAAGHGSEVSS